MRAAIVPRLVGTTQQCLDEIYCRAWVRMNEGVTFAMREGQVRYLQTMALSMKDELASLLLLKKLRLAAKLAPDDPAQDLVGVNSYFEFRFAGCNRRFCRLLHPSVCRTSFDLSIDSRLGAGVVGLRVGQTLLWPDDRGSPRELHVIHVKNGKLARRHGESAARGGGRQSSAGRGMNLFNQQLHPRNGEACTLRG